MTSEEPQVGGFAGSPPANQLENIKVAVRLRPFTEKEKQRNSQRIVDIEQNTIALYSPKHGDVSFKKFTFDYSYWSLDGFRRDDDGVNVPDLTQPNGKKYVGQERVFEDLGKFLLNNALEGYNSALLAYGQTGSGKSYTVSGYGKNEGILPRFARALFEQLDQKADVLSHKATESINAVDGIRQEGSSSLAESVERASNNRYEVHFSMIEIYNEVVRDLLADGNGFVSSRSTLARRGLKVREHPKRGFFVENLTSYACGNRDEIEKRIEEGHLNKSIAATSMNETSSRGHTIYEFRIKQYKLKGPDHPDETLITSVVQLVDLAGSERMAVHVTGQIGNSFVGSRSNTPFPGGKQSGIKKSRGRNPVMSASSVSSAAHQTSSSITRNLLKNSSVRTDQQQRFKESVSINQSLSALGNCIQVLSQYSQQLEAGTAKRQAPKIPYRDSVLTKLLNRCCLSGNSKVVIIATLSPADTNFDDTLSTLRFADRAKQIQTHATVNRISRGEIVNVLQKENERLKQMIDGRVTRSDDSSQTSNFDDCENVLENFKGPRNASSSSNIDSMITPTRSQTTIKKTRDARKSQKGNKNSKMKSSSSNPSLAVDNKMERIVSPASRKLAEPLDQNKTMQKSKSTGHSLATKSRNDEIFATIDSDDVDLSILDEAGLLDDTELGEIKESLISSDSDDSFAALAEDNLTNDQKIGLFNRMLSNSQAASRMDSNKIKHGSRHEILRPRRTNTRAGFKNVSVLSSNLKKSNPYLSNLNPDEQLTGMISYIIKDGQTTIGKSKNCDIILHGPELRHRHALITRNAIKRLDNKDGVENNNDNEDGQSIVYIEPIVDETGDEDAVESIEKKVALMVNGTPVTKRVQLNHCDRLLFGSNVYFVFIDSTSFSKANGETLANLDLVTFDMARNEVLRKVMAEAKNEAMIKEINHYAHRPGTGKYRARSDETKYHVDTDKVNLSGGKGSKLTRSVTIQGESDADLKNKEESQSKESDQTKGVSGGRTDNVETIYRDRLMEDTYEQVIPIAEVNAVAKEMGINISYSLKILTGEEQLPEQSNSNYLDSNASDGLSSSSHGDGPLNEISRVKSSQSYCDDRVTHLNKLDSLDIPPALFIQVHLEDQNLDFYWSKEKFQARRYKILELYGSWDVYGKSGLVEYLIDQSKNEGDFLIDPFVDDPNSTLVLVGHAQITLRPISHLSDIEQSFDVLNTNDEIVGSILIQAVPCHPNSISGTDNVEVEPYQVYSEDDLAENLLENPKELVGKKLVFVLKIRSCQGNLDRYTNVFCQYTLNRDNPTIRTNVLCEISLDSDRPEDHHEQTTFNHSHYICFEKVDQDVIDFLECGFLTIQVVGQYKLTERTNRAPTVISTIINSINKYKYKMDQHSAYNSINYSGSVYDHSNTDSAKSNRGPSSGMMNSNSGASSVVSTSNTVNLFDQQNDDDDGNNSMNGMSQENIIDMILTKRKLDRAENQLHYLKRTINIAEHYNKKHIPVKTVKKLLNSYGHELDSGSLEEMAADGE